MTAFRQKSVDRKGDLCCVSFFAAAKYAEVSGGGKKDKKDKKQDKAKQEKKNQTKSPKRMKMRMFQMSLQNLRKLILSSHFHRGKYFEYRIDFVRSL